MPEPLLEARGSSRTSAVCARCAARTSPSTPEKKIGTGFTSIIKDNLTENQDSLYKASC
jgi:hypothetical protein